MAKLVHGTGACKRKRRNKENEQNEVTAIGLGEAETKNLKKR